VEFECIGVRGVAAVESIESNEVFLAVPKRLIIGIEKVMRSELGKIISQYNCFKNNDENEA
jgi:hypothetical protein